ncbi:MAG TPA: C69 family dipeptidase, partial [Terriglobales bacterium]|nr:C69 family dipeptidase [Terriglobales bacterium]
MKNMKKHLLALGAVALLLTASVFAGTRPGGDCFTVLVGKKASADGSVIVAHNEDDPGDIVVNVRKIQGRDYGASRRVALGNGATYETEGRVAGFLWIEAAGQEFADSFVNDHGVVITSDSCPSRETAEDLTDGGIGHMLRRLMAEKARTAREAVEIAGELVEKYGYRGSGRTYSVADKDEAWMIAVIRGRHWFAQRVPDDEVAVIPNWYTIRRIRTDAPGELMGSPDIVAYARGRGWYEEAKDGSFDFKKAFQRPPRPDPIMDGNTLRHWRGLTWLSGREWEKNGDYPFSFTPAQKVSAESLMALLRDHYEGTSYDATDGYQKGTPNHTKFRTICTTTTINSFIASLNGRRPAPISVMLWLALGRPDSAAYLPVYYGVDELPPGAGFGPRTHDDAALYARHFDDAWLRAEKGKLLQTKVAEMARAVEADYGRMIGSVRGELGPAEASFVGERRAFESEFASLYARDKVAAQKKLDDHIAAAFAEVSGLYDKLLAKPQAPASSDPVVKCLAGEASAGISFLSWDTEGGDRVDTNLLRADAAVRLQGSEEGAWREPVMKGRRVEKSGDVLYDLEAGRARLSWKVEPGADRGVGGGIKLVIGAAAGHAEGLRLLFPFDPKVTPTTVLPAAWLDDGTFRLPAMLNAPDFGPMLLEETGGREVRGRLEGSRKDKVDDLILDLPGIGAGASIRLTLTPVLLAAPPGLRDAAMWRQARRGWLNALQPCARWGEQGKPFSSPPGILGNNVISDPASMSVWFYADQAFFTPEPAPGVPLMPLIRRTVDYWLTERMKRDASGAPTGEVTGYWDYGGFLDANASPLIAAWDYVEATGDTAWLTSRIGRLELVADFLARRDIDGDGLVEAVQSGNRGA